MGSTIVSSGDRVKNDNNLPVFVMGAYRNGPVYIRRVLLTTAVHPGEGLTHPTGAGGEDSWLIHPDKSPSVIAIAELDKGKIADCTTDYTITTDQVPGIMFNLNPGAILRNVQCVDPGGNVNALASMTSSSGTAGSFMPVTEATLINGSATSGFQFDDGTPGTNGTGGNFLLPRVYMRQAYYLADPNAAYTDVMYLLGGV